jgi:hypothetical protein
LHKRENRGQRSFANKSALADNRFCDLTLAKDFAERFKISLEKLSGLGKDLREPIGVPMRTSEIARTAKQLIF